MKSFLLIGTALLSISLYASDYNPPFQKRLHTDSQTNLTSGRLMGRLSIDLNIGSTNIAAHPLEFSGPLADSNNSSLVNNTSSHLNSRTNFTSNDSQPNSEISLISSSSSTIDPEDSHPNSISEIDSISDII